MHLRRFSRNRVRRIRALVVIFGVLMPLLCFSAMAVAMRAGNGFAYDATVMHGLHSVTSERYDTLMRMLSKLGQSRGVVPLDVAVLALLMIGRHWALARFWFAAVGGAALFALAAKHLFFRTRPELWSGALADTTSSFPSSHAMGSMAAMTALSLLLWHTRWRASMVVIGASFVFLVGISRVYLGEHYPSDVIAGWAAALGWVVGIAALMRPELWTPAHPNSLGAFDKAPGVGAQIGAPA